MASKYLLTASVLGVINAIASSNAFANDMTSTFCKPGFYAGLQGGRSDTFYSGKTLVSAAKPTSGASSVNVDGVTTTTIRTTSETLGGQKIDDIGIGGRVYAGYQFNPYFALETGYTQYAKTNFNTNSTAGNDVDAFSIIDNDPNSPFGQNGDHITSHYRYAGEITESAIDLVGKATLPLNHGFGVYGKAGVAYIKANRHINSTLFAQSHYHYEVGDTSNTTTYPNTSVTQSNNSYQAFHPTAGIGANYSIPNSNISVDASYSRVFSSGAIPQASLLALGAEYKFS